MAAEDGREDRAREGVEGVAREVSVAARDLDAADERQSHRIDGPEVGLERAILERQGEVVDAEVVAAVVGRIDRDKGQRHVERRGQIAAEAVGKRGGGDDLVDVTIVGRWIVAQVQVLHPLTDGQVSGRGLRGGGGVGRFLREGAAAGEQEAGHGRGVAIHRGLPGSHGVSMLLSEKPLLSTALAS